MKPLKFLFRITLSERFDGRIEFEQPGGVFWVPQQMG